MNVLVYLIPLALMLGLGGLAVFLWALRSGQFEDLEGAGLRILEDEHDEVPAENKNARTGAEPKPECK